MAFEWGAVLRLLGKLGVPASLAGASLAANLWLHEPVKSARTEVARLEASCPNCRLHGAELHRNPKFGYWVLGQYSPIDSIPKFRSTDPKETSYLAERRYYDVAIDYECKSALANWSLAAAAILFAFAVISAPFKR